MIFIAYRWNQWRVAAILCLMLLPCEVRADTSTDEITVSGKDYEWVKTSRRYVSKAVKNLTQSVDTYLSNDISNVENDSYLRLRIGYVLEEGGKTLPNNNIKFKADLPKTQKKLQLVFESDTEDFQSLEQQQKNNDRKESIQNNDNASAALRFILNNTRGWNNDIDVGLRVALPLDPFVRFTTKRRFQLNTDWSLVIKQQLYYFLQEEFGTQTRVSFDRPLTERLGYFNHTNMRWRDKEGALEFSHIEGIRDIITSRDMLTHVAGVFYQEQPVPYITSYYVATTYRRRLHSDWLFAEVTPSVTWSEGSHFKGIAALSLALEVFF